MFSNIQVIFQYRHLMLQVLPFMTDKKGRHDCNSPILVAPLLTLFVIKNLLLQYFFFLWGLPSAFFSGFILCLFSLVD